MLTKVFVYGTLKQGFGNHYLLSRSELLGSCIVNANMVMFNLGGFPGVSFIPSDKDINPIDIVGEVYEVDAETMEHLDMLEGYPEFYDRTIINTEYGEAWIYHLPYDEYEIYDTVGNGIW